MKVELLTAKCVPQLESTVKGIISSCEMFTQGKVVQFILPYEDMAKFSGLFSVLESMGIYSVPMLRCFMIFFIFFKRRPEKTFH